MVGFTKISPLKKRDSIKVEINGQEFNIKLYLPIKDKAELIDYILLNTFDNKGFFSPLRFEIYMTIGILRWYTDLNFTDTMLRDIEKTYDLICLNNIFEQVKERISEFLVIYHLIVQSMKASQTFINSFAGQLQYTKTDYENLNFNMEEIERTLQDPSQIGFLKEVMEKMG